MLLKRVLEGSLGIPGLFGVLSFGANEEQMGSKGY